MYLTKSDALLANVGTRTALGQARLVEASRTASDAFLSALAWHPGSLRARVGLAESYRQAHKLQAAEEQARIAVSLAPGEPRVIELYESIAAERVDDVP
jgi:Tfp pilus assembly protein PilF